ncbi:MAG: FkbM family methyltransferase [Bradymonadaceae bacterium]|nr:FkbM family methyltransferase [Lujinxingiaceae bacterium]
MSDFDGDLRFQLALNEHMGSQIFWRGYYSEPQLQFLAHMLESDHSFIDVGANHGEFTVFAAKRLPRGRVVAFEPTSRLFERLTANVAHNAFENVVLKQQGLSAEAGIATIYSSTHKYADGTFNSGLPSLFPEANRANVVETIELTTLDQAVEEVGLSRLDIIKMDIEGAEMAALQGAAKTLSAFRPTIILEVNQSTCMSAGYTMQALLGSIEPYGYKFFRIDSSAASFALSPLSKANLNSFQNVACIIS